MVIEHNQLVFFYVDLLLDTFVGNVLIAVNLISISIGLWDS